MKHIVGVGDMAIGRGPGEVLVTHALGSCLGVTVYDPIARIGGLLHVMLPTSKVNPAKAEKNPFMFIDTGLPLFMRKLYEAGVERSRMIVKVAGGAKVHGGQDRFVIGKRNCVMFKKLMWKNSLLVEAEETGGDCPRTMALAIDSGKVTLSTRGVVREL